MIENSKLLSKGNEGGQASKAPNRTNISGDHICNDNEQTGLSFKLRHHETFAPVESSVWLTLEKVNMAVVLELKILGFWQEGDQWQTDMVLINDSNHHA